MLDGEALATVPLWAEALDTARAAAPDASAAVRGYQAIRWLIDAMASDLVHSILGRIHAEGIDDLDAVRAVKPRLVEFSPAMGARQREIKLFLYDNLYMHHRVTRMTQKADRIMSALFEVYMHEPRQLPPHVLQRTHADGEPVARVVADYIAGMTDRFALEEYKKLFDPYERV